jgi:hypothetical protein
LLGKNIFFPYNAKILKKVRRKSEPPENTAKLPPHPFILPSSPILSSSVPLSLHSLEASELPLDPCLSLPSLPPDSVVTPSQSSILLSADEIGIGESLLPSYVGASAAEPFIAPNLPVEPVAPMPKSGAKRKRVAIDTDSLSLTIERERRRAKHDPSDAVLITMPAMGEFEQACISFDRIPGPDVSLSLFFQYKAI